MKRTLLSLALVSSLILSIVGMTLHVLPAYGARPGNYTDYRFDQEGPFYNFDIFVSWEVAPSTAWIYPAFTFGFQAGIGGYMGTQLVGNTKTVLFSIWDIVEGAETAIPTSPNGRRFGGEGTGAQCLLTYDWITNREYRLRIWAAGSNSTGENWIAAIYDAETGVETTIGVIYVKNSKGFTGYGWLINGPSIFLEYFGGEDTCVGQPYSKITWRGPYANNGDYAATRAIVPFYPTCTTNNVLSSGPLRVTHEAGNGVKTTTPSGTSLWNSPSAGILRVDIKNDADNTLEAILIVDGLMYLTKTVSGKITCRFGEFTMAPGAHEIMITWNDPDTGTQQTRQETVLISAGSTASTAQAIPEFASVQALLLAIVLSMILLTLKRKSPARNPIQQRLSSVS